MLIVVIPLYIFLIFPIFLKLNVFYCKELKKLFFAINIFRIPIISGYVEKIKDGFAIHLKKNYAILIPYKKIINMKGSVDPLKDYHFINLSYNVELGSEESLFNPLFTAFICNFIHNFICFHFANKKPYIKIKNKFNIYETRDVFNISLDLTMLFNMLMIVLSLIKIIMEKIFNELRNKKRQNKQSC